MDCGRSSKTPFENFRRSNQRSQSKHEENAAKTAQIEDWLPFVEIFRTFCFQPGLDGEKLLAQFGRMGALLPGFLAAHEAPVLA